MAVSRWCLRGDGNSQRVDGSTLYVMYQHVRASGGGSFDTFGESRTPSGYVAAFILFEVKTTNVRRSDRVEER